MYGLCVLKMLKFCTQSGDSTREKTAIYVGARQLGYEVTSSKVCPQGSIPIGDVPFCEVVAPPREGWITVSGSIKLGMDG